MKPPLCARRPSRLRQVRWQEFQDGWPDTFIENVHELRGRHVVFLMNIVHSSALFAQLSLALVLSRSGALPSVQPL
jgi:hypothetical protein